MIAIIDYGIGNLMSVMNAIDYLGYDAYLCQTADQLIHADRLIIPGVGAFADCVRSLDVHGFRSKLNTLVLNEKLPTLGICVGMQMMATLGHEMGLHTGLDWIQGEVKRIAYDDPTRKIPNVGWEELDLDRKNPLFRGMPAEVEFYFVHSYHFVPQLPVNVIGRYIDGGITAAINRDNIYGTQFHPEKSGDSGLQVLENFLRL